MLLKIDEGNVLDAASDALTIYILDRKEFEIIQNFAGGTGVKRKRGTYSGWSPAHRPAGCVRQDGAKSP